MTVSVYADPSGDYATMSIGGSEKFRLNSDGTATLGGVPVQRMLTLGTKVTTSGLAVDFTGIPSWAKKITVMLNGVSTNGAANWLVQLGTSGGLISTGYVNASSYILSTPASGVNTPVTSGFQIASSGAANVCTGVLGCYLMGGDIWVSTGVIGHPGVFTLHTTASVALGAPISRVRLTTDNGTDTFDAGSISVYVEG